ncbi:hypothetical protein OF83DRAFT_1087605 [Amylostereum chailletii]|nr:hypothetical protein OF83DRAFT_1087605 [Amylostereum chailletii]
MAALAAFRRPDSQNLIGLLELRGRLEIRPYPKWDLGIWDGGIVPCCAVPNIALRDLVEEEIGTSGDPPEISGEGSVRTQSRKSSSYALFFIHITRKNFSGPFAALGSPYKLGTEVVLQSRLPANFGTERTPHVPNPKIPQSDFGIVGGFGWDLVVFWELQMGR